MLVHLQIISAESDKIAESIKLKLLYVRRASKEKHTCTFFAVSVCLRFERPVEVAQMKTTHSLRVVVTQKGHSFRQEML